MNHFSQFKQNRKQKRSVAAASSTNLSNSNIKELEAPNLEEGHNAVELCLQRFSIFNQQDYENGHFDVTFLFGEKELFAHSFVLWSASEVFETMLFGAWAKNEPIPITGHSYNDFKEFLTFLYLGKCSLDVENVMAIVDLAEFYNVQLLKDKCDQFLTNTSPTPENVFKIVETLKTYSLENALENVFEYITINAEILLKNDSFLEVKKDIVVDIVKLERLVIKEEDLFDSIHKWALFQYQKQETVNPVWIKEELLDILPFIRFPVMNVEFLHNNVVPLGHLFSSFQELSFILRDADAVQKNTLQEPASKYRHTIRKSFNLEISDIRGNIARTYLPDIKPIEKFDQTSHIIKVSNGTLKECFWEIDIPKRATKNILFDLNACQIYMIRLVIKEEDLFDSIHKWALFQYQKQEIVNPVWIKEELSDILPFIRFPVMNVEFLHNNVVPLGHLFSSFQELSFILRDADAVQKNTLQEPASKYRHTIRKSYNLEISDSRGNIARTYLPDIKPIEKFDQTSHIIKVSNGTLKECFWEIDIPKRATKNILFDLNACQIYMIRNSQGKLALKNFSNDISLDGPQNQHMVSHIRNGRLFQNAYNNELRDDESDSDECDILSRVHLDNKSFTIGSRCDLKLI